MFCENHLLCERVGPVQPVAPRYYAFVEVGTNSLAAMLVAQGWARTKGVTAALPGQKSKDFSERLAALEAEARHKRLGVWAMAAPKKTETR